MLQFACSEPKNSKNVYGQSVVYRAAGNGQTVFAGSWQGTEAKDPYDAATIAYTWTDEQDK